MAWILFTITLSDGIQSGVKPRALQRAVALDESAGADGFLCRFVWRCFWFKDAIQVFVIHREGVVQDGEHFVIRFYMVRGEVIPGVTRQGQGPMIEPEAEQPDSGESTPDSGVWP